MASGRLLCLLNPQFRRLEDFSLWQRGKAKATYFEQGYEVGYAFEEFACRGEDVKLVGERGSGCTARQASAAPQRARRLRMAPAPTQSTTLPLPPPRSLVQAAHARLASLGALKGGHGRPRCAESVSNMETLMPCCLPANGRS